MQNSGIVRKLSNAMHTQHVKAGILKVSHLGQVESPDPGPPGDLCCVELHGIFPEAVDGRVF